MNCHEVQNHLFADSDGALPSAQRAALDEHVAVCAECRRLRQNLSAALSAWRTDAARTPVPDIEREWHAVRRKIRGGVEAGQTVEFPRPRRRVFAWLAVPITAAAAVAITLYMGSTSDTPEPREPATAAPAAQVSRADSVEVPGQASTTVYVDDKSGWLVVWASEAKQI